MLDVPPTDRTEDFFAALAERGHEPLLRKATGNVLFELRRGRRVEHRLLRIDKGTITVTSKRAAADASVSVDRALFERIVAGEVNAVTAMLRGQLATDGDRRLIVLVQRLFPAPSKRVSRRLIKASGSRT